MRRAALFFGALACFALACAQPDAKPLPPRAESTPCEEPRPEMCTREYRPVCADRDTGVRCITTPCPSTEQVTYGNACTACSDAKVIRHRPGACEEEEAG